MRYKCLEIIEKFVKYIEEWYPYVDDVYLFGSSLWKSNPTDIDILLITEEHFGDAYKTLFPDIHLIRKMMVPENSIHLWSKERGVLSFIIPEKVQYVHKEMELLRDEIKKLNRMLNEKPRSIGRRFSPGYTPSRKIIIHNHVSNWDGYVC